MLVWWAVVGWLGFGMRNQLLQTFCTIMVRMSAIAAAAAAEGEEGKSQYVQQCPCIQRGLIFQKDKSNFIGGDTKFLENEFFLCLHCAA